MWVDVLQHRTGSLVPVPSSWGTASKEARAYRSEGRGACMEPEGTRTVTCRLSDCVCAHETRALMKGNEAAGAQSEVNLSLSSQGAQSGLPIARE
jgi:hypothetical protein